MHKINRRNFSILSAASAVAAACGFAVTARVAPTLLAKPRSALAQQENAGDRITPHTPTGSHVGMLVYSGFTAQDLVEPQLMVSSTMDRQAQEVRT